MSKRDILGDGKLFGGEEESNIEYQPPDEKVVDSALIHKLLHDYITKRDEGELDFRRVEDRESIVHTIESMIDAAGNKLHPQPLIDKLTAKLMSECDRKYFIGFTKEDYLTAVVQAFYNLNMGNEFAIDTRNWSEDMDGHVGWHLKGRKDKPLILNLYGRFSSCGYIAKNCEFIFHNKIQPCGKEAEDCTFSLMPDIEIREYFADPSKGNTLRRMNEDGEWEIIPPESLTE